MSALGDDPEWRLLGALIAIADVQDGEQASQLHALHIAVWRYNHWSRYLLSAHV